MTEFPDTSAQSMTLHSTTWPELVKRLQHPHEFPSKDALPLLKLATFGNVRTPARYVDGKRKGNSLRHDPNVIDVTGIEGDYDGEQVALEEAVRRLEQAQICALVYTTARHRPEAPRWRVLAPLARTCEPGARASLVARLNGALGGILADESFTLSQAFYVGRVRGAPYQCAATYDDPEEGFCIDELNELDDIAIRKASATLPPTTAGPSQVSAVPLYAQAAAKVAELGRKLVEGDGRREMLKSYIASRSALGLGAYEVRALVQAFVAEYFDPADTIDAANVDDIVEHFARKDAAARAEVEATVGPLVASLGAAEVEQAQAVGGADDLARRILSAEQLSAPPDDFLPHVVDKWVPCDEVTLLAGHGGGGKSYIALSLAVHVALGRPFGDLPTQRTGVLFFSAEDGAPILRLRLARVCHALGVDLSELDGRLHLLDASDIDPALHREQRVTVGGRTMVMTETALLDTLAELVARLDVGLVVVDNASDVFDDDEIRRARVRTFIRSLRARIARPGRAVLLLSHVNKNRANQGRAAGSEDYSGSTAWHNSARSRLSLDAGADDRSVTVEHVKANLGARAHPVRLEWHDGVPQVAGTFENIGAQAAASIVRTAERERDAADKATLAGIIADFDRRGERVTTSVQGPATTYRLLRAQAEFPANTGPDRLARLLRELESEGTIFRRVVRTHDRKIREVFTRAPAEDCASAPIPTGGGGDDPFKDIEAAA